MGLSQLVPTGSSVTPVVKKHRCHPPGQWVEPDNPNLDSSADGANKMCSRQERMERPQDIGAEMGEG